MLSSADLRLALRIEQAEAANVTAIAQAVRTANGGTAIEPFAGGVAVFAGIGSPMTHAVGIGLRGPVEEAELERMEHFFLSRGSACNIDLCPLADAALVALVQQRSYRMTEFNNVLVRPLRRDEEFAAGNVPGIREIGPAERRVWAEVVCSAFSDPMPVTEEAIATMSAGCNVCRCWIGEGDKPEAGAAMSVRDGTALFTGDATLPAARGRGWQLGLIAARLRAAQQSGCELAVVSVLPGTSSHRNYERSGFQLVYMRVNIASEVPPHAPLA